MTFAKACTVEQRARRRCLRAYARYLLARREYEEAARQLELSWHAASTSMQQPPNREQVQ